MPIDIVETFPIHEGLSEISSLHFSILGGIGNHPLVGKRIHISPGVIEFKEVYFSSKVTFDNGYSSSAVIYFNNCYFSKDQPINDISVKRLVFDKCIFYNEISFGSSCQFENCEFLSSKCQRINIRGGKFETFVLYNNFIKKLWIQSGSIKKLDISSPSPSDILIEEKVPRFIEDLYISFSELNGTIFIKVATIKDINLVGHINKETSLFLEFVSFSTIWLDSIINEGRLVFSTLNIVENSYQILALALTEEDKNSDETTGKPVFSISKSNLGKTEFYSIDFTRYYELGIHDSFIMDCLFVNIIWPKRLNLSNGSFYKNLHHAKSEREIYRQIKIALSKQGDSIGEHIFHALEMNTFYYALEWKCEFWTKLIIRLSFLTSNYGQSFYRPLLSILILNFPLFYWLVKMNDVDNIRMLQSVSTTSEMVAVWIGEFIKYCNPLHKLDVELLGCAFIIDTIIRIVSSYGIYNIIRATRRFVK